MSLSWRDQLRVVLSPQRVILVRLAKGLRPKVEARRIVPCEPAPAGVPAFQPALDVLQDSLSDRQWQRTAARVILSNHFVRYLVVPWQEKLSGKQEQLALVRFSFAEVYGDAAADWDYRWTNPEPPAPVLACAVDRRLLAGLRDLFKAADLRLAAVEPYLMAAFNRWKDDLERREDWFLLAEPGRVCLAWFKDREWAGVSCQQVGDGWGQELPRILERTLLLAGQSGAPGRLCISAPETPPGAMVLAEGWSGNLLVPPAVPGFVPGQDGAYAMAMNG